MSYWLTDPELFLQAKGTGPDDVFLWRCKNMMGSSSSQVVPIKPDDFDFVKIVKNHLELIGYMFDWDESDYKRLVKYIYERPLLVNGQGLVIAEIYKLNDTKEVPIYMRSLDVLPLKIYVPKLREGPNPLRTAKYWGDVNGKAAMMEEDFNVAKLTARVADLESKNKSLDTNVTKLTSGLATTTGNVADLQSQNKTLEVENKTLDLNVKTLEGKVAKLTADLATQMNAFTTLQRGLDHDQVKNNGKEVWMNDITSSEWVGFEGLNRKISGHSDFVVLGRPFTTDIDTGTNVRAAYLYKIMLQGVIEYFKAVSLEDLVPNKEKARFSQKWHYGTFRGKAYAMISQEDCNC